MSIKKRCYDLVDFLIRQRRSGTTTLLKKIATENDVWVLVESNNAKSIFGDKGISINSLDEIKKIKLKPILIDNFTLIELLSSVNEEFHKIGHRAALYDELSYSINKCNSLNDFLILKERYNANS